MNEQTQQLLDAVRELLERADRYPHADPRQIGSIIVALGTLVDVVERIAQQQEETHE